MKRWAILIVFLYALALLLLTIPVALLAFANWGKTDMHIGFAEILKFYLNWGYWLWLGVLVAGQALLLLLPIHLAERRLPARRPLKIPIIVTAFFLANLCFAGLFALLCAIFTDGAFEYYNLAKLFHSAANQSNDSGNGTLGTMIFTILVFWAIWALVFFRATRFDEANALLKRVKCWLLRGSILELIIAVPSHVIVRRRDDCCAPMGTFWGIATGISVMLLCFGPGVFFLFAERCRKLQPKPTPVAPEQN
jgi:hypothetical protein